MQPPWAWPRQNPAGPLGGAGSLLCSSQQVYASHRAGPAVQGLPRAPGSRTPAASHRIKALGRQRVSSGPVRAPAARCAGAFNSSVNRQTEWRELAQSCWGAASCSPGWAGALQNGCPPPATLSRSFLGHRRAGGAPRKGWGRGGCRGSGAARQLGFCVVGGGRPRGPELCGLQVLHRAVLGQLWPG